MSKNKVALGIASAVIGFTGVAGASVAVSQHTTSGDHGQEASISADADGVSLDGAADALAGLPAIPDVNGVINTVTGIAGGDVVGEVTNAVGSATEVAQGALASATSMLPVGLPGIGNLGSLGTCAAGAVPTSLPVPVALPANTMKAILGQLAQAESLVNMVSGLTAGLPVKVPTLLSASDVFSTVRAQASCAASLAGQPSAIPAACDITAGLPVALPEPAAGVVADVANMVGQKINMGGETGLGLSCSSTAATNAVSSIASNPGNVLSSVQATAKKIVPNVSLPKVDLPALPIPAIPALPALPGVGSAAVPALPDVVGTVQGVVGSVTGGLQLPVDVNGILSGILPSSCAAGASGGLLGSLTAVLSASCS